MLALYLRATRAAALAGFAAAAAAPAAQAALVDGSAGCTTSVLHTFLGSRQDDCTAVASLAQALPGAFRFAPGVLFSDTAGSALLGSTAASGYALQADFGLLRVAAEAHTTSTLPEGAVPAAPSALGSASGRFLDRVTVESATLARGTPVRVRVSGTVEADATTAALGGSAGARVVADLLIGAPGGPLGDVFCTGTGLGSACDRVWGGGSIAYAYEFDIEVGQAFDLSFSLAAVASASGQASRAMPDARSDALALALNSLHAFADPIGSGFTLRADSGHDWRSAATGTVAEPGALALSLAGLLLALFCGTHARRGRSAVAPASSRPAAGPGPRVSSAVGAASRSPAYRRAGTAPAPGAQVAVHPASDRRRPQSPVP